MFGNLLSNVADFRYLSYFDDRLDRDWAEFSAKARGENVNPTEETKETIIPEGLLS